MDLYAYPWMIHQSGTDGFRAKPTDCNPWASSAFGIGLGLLLVTVLAPSAHAVTSAVLVDRELRAQSVRVTAVADDQITYFDAERRLQRASVDQFIQLRAIGTESAGGAALAATAAVPTGEGAVLVLTDGQRIAGRWAGPGGADGDNGEALVWAHPTVGQVTLSLDHVRGWGEAEATIAASIAAVRDGPPTQDRAVLTNGDVIRGFLVAVTDTGVSLQPDGAGEPIALAANRVAKVMLANPDEPREPGHQTLVLHDGSVLAVTDLSLRREHVTFRAVLGDSDELIELPTTEVARIDFTASGRRLVSLIDQPQQVSGGEVFGLPMQPWVEHGALRLHAPVTVTFELPVGARRIAGIAELATGPNAPPELIDWADFELVIDAGGDEPVRHRLHGGNRAVTLNLPVIGRNVRLELDEGTNGPILDRMRLRHAVILIEADLAP